MGTHTYRDGKNREVDHMPSIDWGAVDLELIHGWWEHGSHKYPGMQLFCFLKI